MQQSQYRTHKNIKPWGSLHAALYLIAISVIFIASSCSRSPHISYQVSKKAPLSAEIVVESPEPVSVRLTVRGLDGVDLVQDYPTMAASHRLPLLGLYPGRVNGVEVHLRTEEGEELTRNLEIKTEVLPRDYPDIRVDRIRPEMIAPGMTFLQLAAYDDEGEYHPLPSAIDSFGRVRWFYKGRNGHLLKRLANGNMLIHHDDTLLEIDMLGRETGEYWQLDTGIHHDALELPGGNLLVLSSAPGSFEDGMVEIERSTGKHLRYWDFRTILDPGRPRQPKNLEPRDWLHLNGLSYDPVTDDILLSGRDQSCLVRIDRLSGELVWIAGNHQHWKEEFRQYLLEPSGEPFGWSWGQHAPMFHPRNANRFLVYDNGNKRSYENPLLPEDNYSRAVEYRIDRAAGSITQIWEFGREYGSEFYTPFIGDANYLENGNRLVCFGGITRNLAGEPMEIFDFEAGTINDMKICANIIELSDDLPARELMRIRIEDDDYTRYRGYRCYRAVRMPLYP